MKTRIMPLLLAFALVGCGSDQPTADERQHDAQERIESEGVSQVGLPAIKNFNEKRFAKMVLELRDQAGLTTYTYLANLEGKPVFLGESIGYGLPYTTQYTNPQKVDWEGDHVVTLPQADPNGLFSPASAEGTWILMKDPNGGDAKVVYVEPRVIVTPFRLKNAVYP